MAIVGAVAFSEFFLLTLYLQDVLHYSAVQSGVAFVGFAGTVVVVSNLAQLIVGRGRRSCDADRRPARLGRSVALLARLPVDGHYFWDLFPAFVLGGAGMGLSFVPVTIASLAGVDRADAGVASGPRQHEPADRRRDRDRRRERDRRDLDEPLPRRAGRQRAALDHGFQTALYTLLGLLASGRSRCGRARQAESRGRRRRAAAHGEWRPREEAA